MIDTINSWIDAAITMADFIFPNSFFTKNSGMCLTSAAVRPLSLNKDSKPVNAIMA